jgi:hypothetical protein
MKLRNYFLLALILFFTNLFSGNVFCQANKELVDSVVVPLGYMVVLPDDTLRYNKDTTICIAKSEKYKVKKDKEYHSEEFYGNFKKKKDKNIFLKGLYDVT